MKLVFLDRKSLGSDIDLSPFNRFGEIEMYDFSTPEEVDIRLRDADIAIINKSLINEKTIGSAKNLKLISCAFRYNPHFSYFRIILQSCFYF